MDKPSVLIIDDNTDYLSLLQEALSDKYEVMLAENLAVAEEAILAHGSFDIALVDEHIGKEIGSVWIAEKVLTKNTATSFVLYSGLATEEAILNGLICGADDFLTKPMSLISLSNKLDKLIEYQNKIHGYEDDIKSKENVINISMAQASKYGSCMQLTSRINHCFTYDKIRDEVFLFLHNMGLKGCIAFYPLEQEPIFYSSTNGYCSPVEINVQTLLHEKPRLFRFGSRTIFNHPLISLLVLNLEEGAIDTDIYIDALASVIECLGARMEFLIYKNSLVNVQEQISQAVIATKNMVQVSKHNQQEIMNEIVQSIGQSFHILDMSLEQEKYLTDLVQTSLNKHSQGEVNFIEVIGYLDQALASVDKLKELNTVVVEEILDDEDELF
ncbi:MAG: response regulator [Thalassotalea sp.]